MQLSPENISGLRPMQSGSRGGAIPGKRKVHRIVVQYAARCHMGRVRQEIAKRPLRRRRNIESFYDICESSSVVIRPKSAPATRIRRVLQYHPASGDNTKIG